MRGDTKDIKRDIQTIKIGNAKADQFNNWNKILIRLFQQRLETIEGISILR